MDKKEVVEIKSADEMAVGEENTIPKEKLVAQLEEVEPRDITDVQQLAEYVQALKDFVKLKITFE